MVVTRLARSYNTALKQEETTMNRYIILILFV